MVLLTPEMIRLRKGSGDKIVCLTAYSTPMARITASHVDIVLVGDSLGMVLYGMENTLGVTLEMMIAHGKAVTRGAAGSAACVVVDMPYGTYEDSAEQALVSARRIMDETGAHAVKLEGGDMVAQIEAIACAGIPVMAHTGLQPQSVVREGGYKIKGRTRDDTDRLIAEARAVEEAGAFSVVIEGTVPEAALAITKAIGIPTIGIGASPDCDGQVLVTDDMLGLSGGRIPKFVKSYAGLGVLAEDAVRLYADEVRRGVFPAAEHLYD